MSAPHPRKASLRQVGVPAHEVPGLAQQLGMVGEFIEAGGTVCDPSSWRSRTLGNMASMFGTVAPGEGFVFAARIMPGTKVSEVVRTADGEVRLASTTTEQGWIIGRQLVPVDPSGEVFGRRGRLRAQFGSAVLDVVRFAAGGTVSTTTRVHLDSVDGLRVIAAGDLADNVAALHGLSKPATDDRPISFAA